MFSWNILTCRSKFIRLWFHFNRYWNFIFRTIWISHHYCSWLITWCCRIYWCLPIVCCTRWKVSFVSDTVCSIWCFTVFSWNILSIWCKLVRLWFHFNRYWNFIFRTIWVSHHYCSWFITWGCRVNWRLPIVCCACWKSTTVCDTL